VKNEKAYWISPQSELIPVEITHIQKVLLFPEVFNLSKEYLEQQYKKFSEKVGLEGKAREEIMTNLINEGWIRIRLKSRPDYWIIQVNKLTNRTKENIICWVEDMRKRRYVNKYDEVRIYSFNEKTPTIFLFNDKKALFAK